ncbi:C2H2 and C2HC zinc finger [Glarea lozoyensis ATCC 20868]|uniref:C2H2 and C2HC zinc finger n=1 Tax=Glarea lozoyensis (strain ATCC 20868 / MF5171) TaxID=1116229 RepID=S3D3N6_GLAL2|nr:C2H2 and C2HC zinc finger [Glarea lozoyensis ATCC 20868]EPE26676.1 C2H2 and C2HC zinc finger [Glarea lozoyensis ATCC 20868]
MDSNWKYASSDVGADHRKKATTQQVQYNCDHVGCESTFRCHFNLVRHKQSIHGSKKGCPYEGCNYSSGRMDKMKEHTKRMHSFAKPENPTIPLLVADEPRATPTSFDTRHYGINSQYNLMSRENAFIDETPYIQQQQMYSASGSSSSEVAWNQNHPSFFDEVVYNDVTGNTLSTSNNTSSMSISGPSTNPNSMTSHSRSRDMEGLSDWTGEGQYEDEQYDYKDNVKVEDSGRNYATHRYEYANSSTYAYQQAYIGQQQYTNSGNGSTWP